jgi:hypothetical protein
MGTVCAGLSKTHLVQQGAGLAYRSRPGSIPYFFTL